MIVQAIHARCTISAYAHLTQPLPFAAASTLFVLSVCLASCQCKFLGRQSESIDDVHILASEAYRSLQEGSAPSGQPSALNGSSPLPQNVSTMCKTRAPFHMLITHNRYS